MGTQEKIVAAATFEVPFAEAFASLSDRDALRLLKTLAERFSGCGYSYDKLEAGIEECAVVCAEEEGYRADPYSLSQSADLADRYLAAPTRFGPDFSLAPVIRVNGGVVA